MATNYDRMLPKAISRFEMNDNFTYVKTIFITTNPMDSFILGFEYAETRLRKLDLLFVWSIT